MNYYNEYDKFAADWLERLIKAGLLPHGHVDRRPIQEVKPNDLEGYTQCHFFAGIGGWPLALQYAGWPTDRPVWTGSCPCQPFSVAGKRKGAADDRHLWPVWYANLISERKPATIFGEQVASKDGRIWLTGVRADLEALGYAVGAADLCAAGIGAPHIRQRLFWVADSQSYGNLREAGNGTGAERTADIRGETCSGVDEARYDGADGGLVLPVKPGLEGHTGHGNGGDEPGRLDKDTPRPATETGGDCGLSDTNSRGCSSEQYAGSCGAEDGGGKSYAFKVNAAWERTIPISCADGKTRRIKPGLMPLAHGIPGRVGQIRGYGNAIVPQEASEFIGAYMDITKEAT